MSILDQLNITDVSPKRLSSHIDHFRRRLLSAIDVQIEFAKAEAAGQPLSLTKTRRVKNKETGERESKETPFKPRRWWWRDNSGIVYLAIKSGAKTLELTPGKCAIEVGAAADLQAKLELIREAVRAGELDHCATAPKAERPQSAMAISAVARKSSTARKLSEKR